MSHTATVEVDVKDAESFRKACARLGVDCQVDDTVTMFDGTVVRGMSVRLPGWTYPVVFADGKAHFDNYNGRWGDEIHLNRFKQAYAVEVAKKQARKQGFRVTEKQQKDGSVRLVCQR